MAKKGYLGFLYGGCDKCGATYKPLTYYPRTKEYLCDDDLKIRKRAVLVKEKIKQEQRYKEDFNELNR